MSVMVNRGRAADLTIDWLKDFPPEKRLITGQNYYVLKRMLDLLIVIVSAPVWAPILIATAVIMKIDDPTAPVFFTQLRTGKGGKRFKMVKFRTMVPNAEELKQQFAYANELKWPDFKITNDPRITPLGRILRKTSLDELPQVINILSGEMSLVGPRPTSFSPKTYELWHTERLDITPGLTGLWQIMGRGSVEFDERLRLDIAYIERQSIWLDFQILLHTVEAVFAQRGAH
ncbi:sugar transferase [Longilinea arvoryzae]|uniref:Sugar transferase n=1 Tax=Longilinea arvoryzae TaxID=360412 RepID=A0A0S7BKN0_9CHLR|nr:sugar transferase [Longilinea arvoryzae]